MHPQAPALVQHGSPRGKQAFVHVFPPHEAVGIGIIGRIGCVGVLPELDPVSVPPEELALVLVFITQEPKLQT